MANYAIKHRDEFERMEGSGDCTWLLARKALGTGAFGYNLVEIAPGGQIPAHDEGQSGQVELYAILEGEAVMLLDGEEARGARRHLRLARAGGKPPDPQPLRRQGCGPADRRPAGGRLRADVLGLSRPDAGAALEVIPA